MLFRHGLRAPLREAETMTIAIAGDDELISFEKDIKHGTPEAEDLSHRHSREAHPAVAAATDEFLHAACRCAVSRIMDFAKL